MTTSTPANRRRPPTRCAAVCASGVQLADGTFRWVTLLAGGGDPGDPRPHRRDDDAQGLADAAGHGPVVLHREALGAQRRRVRGPVVHLRHGAHGDDRRARGRAGEPRHRPVHHPGRAAVAAPPAREPHRPGRRGAVGGLRALGDHRARPLAAAALRHDPRVVRRLAGARADLRPRVRRAHVPHRGADPRRDDHADRVVGVPRGDRDDSRRPTATAPWRSARRAGR